MTLIFLDEATCVRFRGPEGYRLGISWKNEGQNVWKECLGFGVENMGLMAWARRAL